MRTLGPKRLRFKCEWKSYCSVSLLGCLQSKHSPHLIISRLTYTDSEKAFFGFITATSHQKSAAPALSNGSQRCCVNWTSIL